MTTRKAARETEQKTAAKKASAKKASAAKTPAKKSAAGKSSATRKAGKSTGESSARRTEDNYTDPALRERVKAQVIAGDKGGHAGQWSARKAQLVAHEYEAQGGGYKHARTDAQNSLKQWGEEHWHTEDGKEAIQGDTTHRYLPDAAWNELSPEDRAATDRKKVAGSKRGKQFVANTPAASKARKHASKT